MNKALLFSFTCFILLIFSACEDPTTVGSDLLDDEAFSLEGVSDFDIEAKTINSDKVVTYIKSITSFTSYPIGSYEDPIFGSKNSTVFAELVYNAYSGVPNLTKSTIDSAVLVLSYDTLSTYGNLSDIHHISVYEATSVSTADTIYNTVPVEYGMMPMGEQYVAYKPKDSITIVNYEADTATLTLKPQIRIPLETARFANLFSDYDNINTSTDFVAKFKGFVIKSESELGSILGLNLGLSANDGSTGINGVYFYYRDSANTKKVFRMTFSDRRFIQFDSGFAAGPQGQVLNSAADGENYLFLEGLGGPEINLKFKDLNKVSGKIINHAELEMFAAQLDGDDLEAHPFVPQLTIGYKKDGQFLSITDISDLVTALIDVTEGFGGNLVSRTGTPNGSYKMNITKAVKAMLAGDIPNNELIISVQSRAQRPHRGVFYGSKHPQYAIRLKIAYTNP